MAEETRAAAIDWAVLKQDVNKSIDLLRICWEGTEKGEPELHAMMVRDLYRPLLHQLGEFCASVEVQ